MASSDENDDGLLENEDIIDAEILFEEDDEKIRGDNVELANRDDSEDNNKNREKRGQTERRVVRNPRIVLNFERLRGPNGFDALLENFTHFKFKGKHFEKEDLTEIMKIMQHWMCHHLYPGYDIETCMKALEKIGKKRVVHTHIKRIKQEAKSADFENKENISEINLDSTSVAKDDLDELPAEEPMED